MTKGGSFAAFAPHSWSFLYPPTVSQSLPLLAPTHTHTLKPTLLREI